MEAAVMTILLFVIIGFHLLNRLEKLEVLKRVLATRM
jgi:hypothetical protein